MSIVYTDDKHYSDIADAIRSKGVSGTFKPDEMAQAVLDIPSGGITPTGNINITDTNVTDVTNYATAQVVSENLKPENIKKDIDVLGIIGSFEGGGGSLPSVISKIGGGSFTLANDTLASSYKWEHNLGELPKGYMLWTDDDTYEPYNVGVIVTVIAEFNQMQTGASTTEYGAAYFMRRNTSGNLDTYSETISFNNLKNYATATMLGAPSSRYLKAGCTYKWFAWA